MHTVGKYSKHIAIAALATMALSIQSCGNHGVDTDADKNQLWGYCLRIENNADELITLKNKNLYLTDEKGRSLCECSEGFNGELPDLQPGEYFEYGETAQTSNISSVLYGFCSAVTAKGKELKINFPVLNFGTKNSFILN